MPQLLPPIRYRVVGDDNLPLVGGKIYTYTAGTTTPKATYTTFGMGAANTNPIILDENGEATIWLDGAYKIRITDENDNILAEEDNVRDLTTSQTFTDATLAGTLTISSTAVTWSGNPTHSGNHTFTSNVTVNGNTTLGNASSDTLTVNADATFADDLTVQGNTTLGSAGSDTVTVTAAMTLAGNVTVSTTGGELRHGPTYTPTLTAMANVSSATASVHKWFRIGDVVVVNGSSSVTPTAAAGTATQVGISLPVASNLSHVNDIRSPAAPDTSLGHTIPFVSADTANDRAILNFGSGSTSACGWSYTFMYEVK